MFSWSVTDVADALQRAAERGVVVRVVLDGQLTDDTSPAIATLRSAPLDDLVFCGTSSATVSGSTACVANYGTSINHNKIFTFSTSGSWKRVVMVTSQNMTYTQDNLFNNAVVVHEDYDLYDHYTAYFNDLRAERKNNDYYHDSVNGYHKSPNTAVTSYHSPASSGDIVDGVLSYFSAYQSGCTTDVAEAMFTAGRQAVADELLRIARMGCKVRVVYSSMDKAIRDTLIQSGNVSLKKYDDGETSNYDGRRVAIHSKYLIVHGNYNGTAGRTIVFTGSHNLSRSALVYNDETVVKIEHPDVSAGFQDNFATLWSRAKCVSPESGSCLY
jgi:phosphatidylserine/phosphatidylglycerophosphate/cardiolipin synthase-like enzyme